MKKRAVFMCVAVMLLAGCQSTAEMNDFEVHTPTATESKTSPIEVISHVQLVDEENEEVSVIVPEEAVIAETTSEETQTIQQPEAMNEAAVTPVNDNPSAVESVANEEAIPQGTESEAVPEPTPEPAPEPAPEVAPEPTRPPFDAATVINGAAAQISSFMTRDNGPATGMGYFTFSFSVYDSMDKMISDLTVIMQQEQTLYGNTWFDLAYLGESGGFHTFQCYRA